MKYYQKGITLVELMIVVAIIGIIAAVSIPSYRRYVSYSQVNACARYILPSRLIATNLIISNNNSVAGITEVTLGLIEGGECITIGVDTTGGVLSVTGTSSGGAFTMTRQALNGSWSCSVSGVNDSNCSDLL